MPEPAATENNKMSRSIRRYSLGLLALALLAAENAHA
jgi:hypothetical protein